MSVVFNKPDGSAISAEFCERNLNLLAHAQAIELDVGSQCGGHGVCGGDRVQLPAVGSGEVSAVTEAEREHLSEAELRAGWRLACQCFPEKSGLEIEVRTKR